MDAIEEQLMRDIATLRRIVIEGNGEPSLVSRVTALEGPVKAMIWLGATTLLTVLGIAATLISERLK